MSDWIGATGPITPQEPAVVAEDRTSRSAGAKFEMSDEGPAKTDAPVAWVGVSNRPASPDWTPTNEFDWSPIDVDMIPGRAG